MVPQNGHGNILLMAFLLLIAHLPNKAMYRSRTLVCFLLFPGYSGRPGPRIPAIRILGKSRPNIPFRVSFYFLMIYPLRRVIRPGMLVLNAPFS
jgi:hypothetical protein